MESPAPAHPSVLHGAGHFTVSRPVLYAIFFLSGVSALLYQLVWQRSLLTIFGSNVESVAVVVSSFMVGLGIGSIFGGWLSEKPGLPLLLAFSIAEAIIGGYGLMSLDIFHTAGQALSGGSLLQTGAACFGLLLVPTLFMGCTLPLLVTHHVKAAGNVGESVSWLYFVNTLGAAGGCIVAAVCSFRFLGMHGTVVLGACLNGIAAALMFFNWYKENRSR